jgi:hypothetical protein
VSPLSCWADERWWGGSPCQRGPSPDLGEPEILPPQPSKTALAEAFAPANPCGFTLVYPARHVQTALRHAAGRSGRRPFGAERVGEGVGKAWPPAGVMGKALPEGSAKRPFVLPIRAPIPGDFVYPPVS